MQKLTNVWYEEIDFIETPQVQAWTHLHVCGEDELSDPVDSCPAAETERPPWPWRSSRLDCKREGKGRGDSVRSMANNETKHACVTFQRINVM